MSQIETALDDALRTIAKLVHQVKLKPTDGSERYVATKDLPTGIRHAVLVALHGRGWIELTNCSSHPGDQRRLDEYHECVAMTDVGEGRLAEADMEDSNTPPEASGLDDVVISTGGRSVRWGGESFSFTATQGACVEVLYRNWRAGVPDVGDDKLLVAVEAEAKRLKHVFRNHPAWGTMIIEGQTKGTHRLADPEK